MRSPGAGHAPARRASSLPAEGRPPIVRTAFRVVQPAKGQGMPEVAVRACDETANFSAGDFACT